jgi:hypothetical protein
MSFVPFFHHCQKFVCATLGTQPDLVAFAISWSLCVDPHRHRFVADRFHLRFALFVSNASASLIFFAAHECVQHERGAAPLNEIFYRDLDAASVPWFFGSFRRPQGFFWRFGKRLSSSIRSAMVSLPSTSVAWCGIGQLR